MGTNRKVMWLIAAILLAVPSVTSQVGIELKLDASKLSVQFKTQNYPQPHNAIEESFWVVSAPGNVDEILLSCYINIYNSPNCINASFFFYNYVEPNTLCSTGHFSKKIKGSSTFFRFKSSMSENSVYKGFSCWVSYDPGAIPTGTTAVDPSCICGKIGTPRIVGGNETTPHKYPWQAKITFRSSRSLCGGSVIAKQWVLSAAHCVLGKSTSNTIVILGEHNCSSHRQFFGVVDFIIHENYGARNRDDNDIALLKLAKPIETFNEYISPICLPFNYKYDDFTDKTGILTGWGVTNPGDINSVPMYLKEISLKLIMYSKCTRFNGYMWLEQQITDSMICGKAENGGIGHGDSGSPMVWMSPYSNLYFQLGVYSFGPFYIVPNKPDVFTKVSRFVEWIEANTRARDEFCVRI